MPLWKLKLTEEEYTNLKETLVQNAYRLEDFGIEAALCYAEWWRRDYNGGIPSREDVAVGLGLPHYCWEQLYKAARHGLKSHGFAFIHSLKGNEYFRTLLNQGGLPVNYIKNGTNLSGFSRFLIGLVEELSSINIDWDDNNIDLIKNFNCIAYLGKAFKNDNIYDVSLQIAHAIISEEDRWLPYDDTDSSLSELTKSLKREYRRVKSEHRTKPLSLSWKLRLTSSKTANLFVNLNIVKEISSKSIEGLNYQSCYTFDVFVSGILVGKYVRKSLVKDDKGEVIGAIYSRITVGVANDIKWSGEPVVEVKIRCDNDDRLFPTLCGSYPPNFECPQVFQMLDDNVYSLKSTANAENNIAVFSTNWKCDGSHNLLLNGELYSAIKFTDKVDLHNCMSNEDITITNEFTPYSAEFRGTYIQWVEQSNFKLLTRIPVISVFDQTGTRVGNIKPKYRVHNSKAEWRNLSNSCLLPFGLVDIKVEFPDNKYVMETFYFIDDMTFVSRNETMFSTELHLYSRHVISAKVDECENLSVEMTDKNTWRISRDACASKYSPTCNLKIIAENNPPLKVSVVAPFEGIVISDLEGKIVPSGKIISYDNLRYFNIISHGQSGMIDVTYKSDKIKDDNTIKHLKSPVIEGIVPLSDYRDLFARMFQLYGANTFDRSSSIELKICDKRIYIRKFVLDSELSSDKIRITDYTSEDTSDFIYDGDVYALPVSENIKPAELVQIKLEPYNRQMNLFTIPDELLNSEAILFYEQKEDLIDLEDMGNIEDVEQNEADGFSRFFFAIPKKACLRKNANRTYHIFNHRNGKIELVPEDNRSNKCFTSLKSEESIPVIYQSLRHSGDNHVLCPHCGNNLSEFKNLDYLRISATQIGRTLATLLLDNAEPIDSNDADVVYEGRKYITFTDSRQGSARSAMGLNQDVERSWIRASIFHKLADMRLNDVKPGGLTPDEEAEYNAYLSIREHLPTLLFEKFKRLEEKKNGTPVIPNPEEVSWGQISQSLENDSNFKKLYEHVDKARGRKNFKNATDYLKALLVDQFGWIPKRANSLETMGFVRLVYPALKNAKCPALIQKRCTDTDWQNFLKICMDYVIRGGRHYMLSGAYKDYLTQNKYCSPIYPSNSELRKNGSPVSKWFKVNVSSKGINENQNRLVLLLCAVLGYDDISQINQIKIADINSMLDAAWDFLRQNVLEATDVENQGYMLDLMGDKVKLQLIEKGYLCPVDNVIIDAPFCGYSPRMNGYIGRENFDRFKIKTEFVNPLFPFKSADQTEKNVMEWIEKNFFEQKAAGVFGVMNSRVFASKPIFISAEHSAQQSSEDLDRYEREFNEGKINILSCSTTMEMGVDIGGITEVVMNNVPPKSSNYLQRTGRAGRRNETKALALTVCAPNPIGTHTWNNPDYPITHVTETPLLKLESRQLIQRHVNAMVFASFVADQGGIRVTATLRDFFVTAEGMSFFDKFLNYIDSVISGKVERLQEPYSKLIKGTSLAQITLADAAQVVKKDIVAVYNVFDAHKGALAKAIESLKNESGTTNAIKAIEKQEENLLKTSMLSYLAENSFLPSAGLPLGLVECLLGGKEKVDGNSPTLHISQAISSYAPGNPVVKNEWVYEPNGIRLKTKYDDSTSRYIIQNCTHCGYTTIIYGSAKTDCPKCGRHGTMHGIKDISLSTDQRFTEVVEPAAFSVAWDSTPTRKMDSLGSMNFIQPILLEMDAWLLKTNSAKMSIRCSTPRSEILFYNKGTSGYGYAFCPYCGRMKSEKSPDSTERMLSHHKHLLASTSCPGGENDGAAVRRHVLLVGRYQTDFVEIKFYDKDNNLVEDTETLYSLGVILSRKLTELLGVNDGEIEFGYDGINHSIFIYDTALGGAGYSLLFREYKDEVLKMALETLERCDCERSCTKCLIDRRSQWYTNYLNRPKALEWLRQEVKARVAPKEIIYLMPDSHAVTSDITTEFYQLTRNKDISGIRIFVDDNISQWDAETFPFIKILTELSLEGVDVAFILPSVPDVKSLSSADSATLIAEVFKTNFKCLENTLPTGLFPLMVVIMNDGIVKTYFGKNIDTSYSKNWGSGDVFITTQPNSLSYADINRMQLLSAFSSDDSSFMFEYRIREHSSLGRFFDSLKAPETGNWNRIISNLRGKAVSIEYSDRYLKTPLGCMLLAKMISSLKNEADLVLVSIKVIVTNIVSINDSDVAVNAIKDFANGKKRNHFLKDAIFELTGIEPEIQDTGYVEHERCLTVKADNAEVCIRPDAGIAKGWAPFGRDNAECTDRDFREDWNIDLELFNKQQIGNGILYTISYKQL